MRKFFKSIGEFLTGKNFIEKHAEQVINALNVFKNIIESPAADFATGLTPTKIDDTILQIMRRAIPKAILAVDKAHQFNNCLLNEKTDEGKINCILQTLKSLPKNDKGAYYLNLATRILNEILEAKGIFLKQSDVQAIIEGKYQIQKLASQIKA